MKKAICILILISVCILFQMISIFPWWAFVVPVFMLGALLPLVKWKVPAFLYGFSAGFLVWILATLYFEVIYQGEITAEISKMIFVPQYLLYVIIGLMGGVLTGLAFYSGFLLRKGKELLRLEVPKVN